MDDERDDSFHTAEDVDTATSGIPANVSYGLSPAAVCIDCSIDVPMTRRERAISAAQIAREGKNVRVVAHIRQDVDRSYKEMYVDVTGKLPSFARAVLPTLLLYMENAVDFPKNTASLVCMKPKAFRGACAFSETMLMDLKEEPNFTMKIPTGLATPHERRKIDHVTGWKNATKESKEPKCTVHKRFLLDVGSDSFFFRNLRSFMIRKFVEAFVDMVREVEMCVRAWHTGSPKFDESVCCQGGVSPGPRFWPKHGESVQAKAEKLISNLKTNMSAIPMSPGPPVPRGRERKSSSMFLQTE